MFQNVQPLYIWHYVSLCGNKPLQLQGLIIRSALITTFSRHAINQNNVLFSSFTFLSTVSLLNHDCFKPVRDIRKWCSNTRRSCDFGADKLPAFPIQVLVSDLRCAGVEELKFVPRHNERFSRFCAVRCCYKWPCSEVWRIRRAVASVEIFSR